MSRIDSRVRARGAARPTTRVTAPVAAALAAGALLVGAVLTALGGALALTTGTADAQRTPPRQTPRPRTPTSMDWPIHDPNRPPPPVVTPPAAGTPERAGRPPSDAVVLFSGTDLSQWRTAEGGGPARWAVRDGYMEVAAGAGSIETARGFGDCQLHVEWMAPAPAKGEGQDRGNSGVFLMGRYEVQVLDSYENTTYPDGQAAAIYGQYPPLVNASRPPGEWQTYDIVFRAPRWGADGTLLRPARMTVFHNGVLVHDGVELTGPTAHQRRPPYERHAPKLPLSLQDHEHPVRFRNIWVRELEE